MYVFTQVLAIGDSMHHDIGGAAALGIDSLLIAGGIHADQLLDSQKALRPQGLEKLCDTYKKRPTYVSAALTW